MSKRVVYISCYTHSAGGETSLELLESGVSLGLFLGPGVDPAMFAPYPNVCLLGEGNWRETAVHRELEKRAPVKLPETRNRQKDTLEHMVSMHARTEWMARAVALNPWNATHFAWIDFDMPSLFRRKAEAWATMREIAAHTFPERGLWIAGCWPKMSSTGSVVDPIHWRFCGGFFLGDGASLLEWDRLCQSRFAEFMDRYQIFTWEVNYWAWIEATESAFPGAWYRGDHNDTILHILPGISADTYTEPLAQASTHVCETPYVPHFYAGSASFAAHQGHYYINTRYVNYWMYPNGCYRFANGDQVIENRNYVSELDPLSLTTTDYREMNGGVLFGLDGQPLVPLARSGRAFSEGLEDIRLFSGSHGRLRFIATNVDYSPTGKNRMILGTYCLETLAYKECAVLVPPDGNGWYEKNWIPLYREDLGEEWFLYKWSPMEWGTVNPATNQLEIRVRHEPKSWLTRKMRGSTAFVEYGPLYWVAVAHFSEEHGPRHYYHVLVLVEKATLKPVRTTRTFCFERLSVEFCLGFAIQEGKYVFWVSRFDRDPIRISVPMWTLPFSKEA